jgi:hypothetical protein
VASVDCLGGCRSTEAGPTKGGCTYGYSGVEYTQPLAAEARACCKERQLGDNRTRALLASHHEAKAAVICSLGDDDVPQ